MESLSRKAQLKIVTVLCGVMSLGNVVMSYAAEAGHQQAAPKMMTSYSQNKPLKFSASPQQIEGRRLVGKISVQNTQLEPGDVVVLKLFDREERQLPENVKVVIKQPEQESMKSWSYELANAINHNLVGIRAGQQNGSGIIAPAQASNYVYASGNSIVHRIETEVQKHPDNSSFSVANLTHQIPFNSDGTHVTFDVASEVRGTVTAKLFDANDMAAGSFEQELSPGNQNMSLRIHQPSVGKYRLQLTFKSSDGSLTQQQRLITVTHDETDV
ncbi:hypothetical protein JQC92_17480 [Shewanella sp. 202IG2-18]|uniref:hypothetical protein n=1 Tax=Parashewanella hymeniacidonis TaxID=2807618 RepID=UPI001960A523|nr:hypothetical protein [Parashewanella hymeniacidonis]MBM7073803.1 hypothetical protein [Parashewanella hymeniacidonis]